MASQLINLDQLKLSISRLKSYSDSKFAEKKHDHNDLYYTETEIDTKLGNLELLINAMPSSSHTHGSDKIIAMTGYSKPDTTAAITSTDSLNAAIGKLEKGIELAANNVPNLDGVYLKINDVAARAKKLDTARAINLTGAITGTGSFDGSEDITISTTLVNASSDKITAMTGYIKPDITSAILTTDSLNVAIGKLEKAIDGKQEAGVNVPHNHNNDYYTKSEIGDMLADISGAGSVELAQAKAYTDEKISALIGSDTPEALNTLQELADALADDADFAGTVTVELGKKADKNHSHDVSTQSTAGFMSADDKKKLDGIADGATNYIHPTTAGNKHIPAGGSSGQALIWSADGTAEWGNVASTDQYVKNTLNQAVKAYITATTSASTEVGEQVFDTGVYLTANAGELYANKFIGTLEGSASSAQTSASCTGNAATATTANQTKSSLSINVNGDSAIFNGSKDVEISISAATIGALSTADQAAQDDVIAMLNDVFAE